MQIKNMFEKQIDRDIKGVIKVGQSDEENVYQEYDLNREPCVRITEFGKLVRSFLDNNLFEDDEL